MRSSTPSMDGMVMKQKAGIAHKRQEKESKAPIFKKTMKIATMRKQMSSQLQNGQSDAILKLQAGVARTRRLPARQQGG